jgi:hypothetical protein
VRSCTLCTDIRLIVRPASAAAVTVCNHSWRLLTPGRGLLMRCCSTLSWSTKDEQPTPSATTEKFSTAPATNHFSTNSATAAAAAAQQKHCWVSSASRQQQQQQCGNCCWVLQHFELEHQRRATYTLCCFHNSQTCCPAREWVRQQQRLCRYLTLQNQLWACHCAGCCHRPWRLSPVSSSVATVPGACVASC